MATMIQLKSAAEIAKITASGAIVARVLDTVGQLVRPGVSTAELDAVAHAIITDAGASPSFLGYGQPPFPGAICASIDHEVVHGIPSPNRILQEGSLISIDVGACLDGYHADAARTFAVGKVSASLLQLIKVTEECFWRALAKVRPGARVGDLGSEIQRYAESHGYGVVRELTGHGIGRNLHESPDLPNYGRSGRGPRLEPGLVLAMEPMINMGTRHVKMQDDGWTIVTADGLASAHYENTFVVTDQGPVVLTVPLIRNTTMKTPFLPQTDKTGIETGAIVRSEAGHDRLGIFIVLWVQGDYAYLADGRSRLYEKPKKKRIRHMRKLATLPEKQVLDQISRLGDAGQRNAALRKLLRQYIDQVYKKEEL
jgi:methionyl aminopeptidase